MPNKPILFSGPMVKAILESRKTMTRRVLKPQPGDFAPNTVIVDKTRITESAPGAMFRNTHTGIRQDIKLQHAIGDLLWVRETWRPLPGYSNWDLRIKYAVDGAETHFGDGDYNSDWNWPKAAKAGNVPSIFMPKWASRITLKVTSVKVERLQDISEEDAIAEGVIADVDPDWRPSFNDPDSGGNPSHILAFHHLWDSLNAKRNEGKYAWDQNPWVSVTSFEPIFKNINEIGEQS